MEETVSSEVEDLAILKCKDKSTEVKQDKTSILSNLENIKVASPLHRNVNTSDGQLEEVEREGSKTQSPPIKDLNL